MEKNMSMLKRIMAVLLVLTMIAGNIPMGVRAEEVAVPEDSYLETSITEGMVFAVNEPTEYTYKTCPDAEDAGKTVKGSFAISKDGTPVNMADVAKLEYKDSSTGNWYEFYTDFGPATGFPLMNLTSNFRITFKETGNYSVTVSINEVNGGTLFSDTKNIKVEKVDATVKSTLSENELIVNKLIDFTVTTEANSDFGKNVIGSFVVKEGDTVINLTDVAQLEYYEIQNDTWYPLAGDFGPSTGFPLQNTSSQFRIKFTKAGTYTVLTTLKDVDAGTDLISAEETIEVKYVKSVLTTDMAEKTYVVGRETFYSFTTTPNSDDKVKVKGAFEVKQGGTVVNLSDVAELKYYETQSNQWLPLTGEFGPADGFEMSEATSNFSVIFKQPGTYTVKVYMKDMSGKELCATEVPLTVTEPTAVYSLKGGVSIEDKWYGPGQTVTVKVDNVLSDAYLAAIKLNGTAVEGAWVNDGSNNWSKDVVLNATGSVQYGNQTPVTVKIDAVPPTVEILHAFGSIEGNEEKTTVVLKIGVGESGIDIVKINGNEITLGAADEDGNYVVTIPQTYEINAEVINGAGVSSAKSSTAPVENLGVTFSVEGIEYGVGLDNKHYVNSDAYLVIKITGADNGSYKLDSGNTKIVDSDGNNVTLAGEWTYVESESAWVNKIALANGLDTVYVTPASAAPDGSIRTGRQRAHFYSYAVDAVPPAIVVERDNNPVNTVGTTEYYNTPVTYTLTISDILLGENNPSNVTYTIDGVKTETIYFKDCKDSKVEIPVGNGEKLTNITVTAEDKTGNKTEYKDLIILNENLKGTWTSGVSYDYSVIVDTDAPEIELSLSENVTSLYENSQGEYFAKVEPVDYSKENKGAASTVTIYANITDKNLDEAAVSAFMGAAGWTMNADGKWEKSITVDPDKAVAFDFAFMAKDLAQYNSKGDVILKAPNASGNTEAPVLTIPFATDKDSYTATLLVDRRAPSSNGAAEVPEITLNAPGFVATFEDGKNLYNNGFTFTMTVTDKTPDGFDAGIESISWEIDDGIEDVTFFDSKDSIPVANDAGEEFTVEIPVNLVGNNETNNANILITLKDNAGNVFIFTREFAVDNLAPRVNVVYDNNDAASDTYFKAERTATITITDINYNGVTVTTEGEVVITENGAVCTYAKDGNYTLSMTTTDLAGNTTDNNGINYLTGKNEKGEEVTNVAPTAFTVDMTPPVVEVTMDLNGGTLVNTLNGVDYYNANVTYKVKVSDLEINKDTDAVAYVKFILEDGTEELRELLTVSLNDENAKGTEVYETDFTVTDGQVLTGIEIEVIDNAGNKPAEINGFAFDTENNVWNYTGNDVAVDTTAPEITVTKTVKDGKFVKDYKGVDYYNAAVTYEFKVEDAFLNPGAGYAELVVSYLDGSESVIYLAEGIMAAAEGEETTANLAEPDVYTGSFTVEDGMAITDITLNVKDNAGNTVAYDQEGSITNLTVEDTDALTAFAYDETAGIWNYTGNTVVADATVPEIGLSFSKNVESVFFNTKNNTIYAILTSPVVGGSGQSVTADDEKVTVTIKVTDKNLAIDNDFVNALKANPAYGFEWSGNTPVNEDTTVTFTATSAEVGTDGVATFVVDVNAIDLAGWIPADFESDKTADDRTFMNISVDDATGCINYNVSVDRQRPSSSDEDVVAPIIEIDPTITPTTTADGKDLFNGAFSFNLHVTDGEESVLNSGIKYVNWTIKDSNGVVAEKDVKNPNTDVVFAKDYVIDVALAQEAGESNVVTLTIIAEDNVGNQISFNKVFGVDNLAPRVTITQSNQSAQNGFYFNRDQVITVKIEDLNFEPTTSSVKTEVPFNGWQNVGENTYQTVLTYNQDGDYTFEMETTDRAKNKAEIDYTTGLVALQSFTVDKTAPVIHVNYNPAFYVDVDGAGVQYFDEDRTVTVTIEEHNFRAADVVSELGARNALAAWTDNGDNHTAYSTFTEGNGYSVKVNYTDLAGNPAQGYVSPTFSIDKTAPTIELTKGEMTTSRMNIVSGDLLLGFTINDAQDNLKDFGEASVEVMYIGTDFKQKKVEGAEFYTVTGAGDRTTGYIDFTNIENTKANDGIYTVRITASDYAGHVVTLDSDLVFSLNRFGSTFMVNDAFTEGFLAMGETGVTYHQNVSDKLVVKEINPNKVYQNADKSEDGSLITISVNGSAFILNKGEDYDVSVEEVGNGNNKWYEYTYSINPSVFDKDGEQVDGEYSILFYSEDEANNKNTNESNEGSAMMLTSDGEYSGKIEFTLDHKNPVVTILGIEEGGNYNESFMTVDINISDNTPVAVRILVDGTEIKMLEDGETEATNTDWFFYDKDSGNYKLNLSEKKSRQDVEVIVADAAGNEIAESVNRLNINSNVFFLFINNVPAVLATVVGLIGLTVMIIALLKKRKKGAA